mgnify:CR=1 FL=1
MNNISIGEALITKTVKDMYKEGQTDYFLDPINLIDDKKNPVGQIKDGDSVIFCCRRGEREIQLTRTFVDPSFNEFPVIKFKNLNFIIMTLYHKMFKNLPVSVAFPPLEKIMDTMGEVISKHGLSQLRIAESEKFAHITFFLNGGNNEPFPGEDGVKVPSPKGVPFDSVPELSSAQVTEEILKGLNKNKYALIAINFANGDVIGHIDNLDAKIKCAEVLDKQLGVVVEAAKSAGYVTTITADHGVLETAVKEDGSPNTRHTDKLVPFVLVFPDEYMDIKEEYLSLSLRKGGSLKDVAPTILQIMNLPKPEIMTGKSLIQNFADYNKANINFKKINGNKTLFIILDGWGIGKDDETNPIFLANTPFWDKLIRKYPFTQLKAAGRAVGLLEGKPGNSEAGHMNIGAGRIITQDDARIDLAIEDGSFHKNPVFLKAMETVKRRNSALHLIALLSKKSSHGSMIYPLELMKLAKEKGLKKVYVHIIFDGRSTQPGSAPLFLKELSEEMDEIGIGKIVSGVGRGIALDRDRNYHKTKKAYDSLVFGIGREAYK